MGFDVEEEHSAPLTSSLPLLTFLYMKNDRSMAIEAGIYSGEFYGAPCEDIAGSQRYVGSRDERGRKVEQSEFMKIRSSILCCSPFPFQQRAPTPSCRNV